MEELLALIALLEIDGIGGRHVRKLRRVWGSLAALWDANEQKKAPAFLQPHLGKLSALRQRAEEIIRTCERLGITVIPYYDRQFPPLLEEVSPPPAILYKKGMHPLIGQPLVAVVGTRKPTSYGLRVTEHFVEALVKAGVGIVSGLAYGIDGQAHRITVERGGKTIAVLAHGLDQIYPPVHRRLAEAILAEGAWLSEYPPSTRLHPLHFPYRNRIIAGLSHLTLVIESRPKGGALFTAKAAFDANRPVFAVPGDIFSAASEGTHALIAQQIAQLAYTPQTLIDELRAQSERLPLPTASEQRTPVPSDPLQAQVYELLTSGQKHVDELCVLLGRSISEIAGVLMTMEIAGWIIQKPGGFILRAVPPDAKP